MAQTFEALYYEGWETLQQCSDEKQVYMAKFSDYVRFYDANSLLDIGAGDGQVALPLSETVDDYVAVEQNSEYAQRLRQAGRRVVEGVFPVDVEGQYDLVIMSHVISHTVGEHTELVPPAWKLVRPGGHMLMVTHRSLLEDDWSRLLDRVGLGYGKRFNDNLRNCLDDLRGRGETELRNVTTTLASADISRVMTAMAFLASNGDRSRHDAFMNKADEVKAILDDGYRGPDGISFPFMHLFVSTRKPVDDATGRS